MKNVSQTDTNGSCVIWALRVSNLCAELIFKKIAWYMILRNRKTWDRHDESPEPGGARISAASVYRRHEVECSTIAVRVPIMYAVCIRCGGDKHGPAQKCRRCRFSPQSDEDKAKSLVLSTAFEINGEYRGKSLAELKIIGADIAAGKPYEVNDADVKDVLEYARLMNEVTPKTLLADATKWLALPFTVLILFLIIAFL
jgi:ribosomal protein L40E